MPRLSPVQKETMLHAFKEWLTYLEAVGDLPAPNFSPTKRFLALHQALHGPLSLPEILEEAKTGTSIAVLKNWRNEPVFASLARRAAKSFATFLENIIATPGVDTTKRLVLTELLTTLPGFDICNNALTLKINNKIPELNSREDYKELYDLILAYRDVVRLDVKETYKKPEDKLAAVLNPLLVQIEEAVKKGRQDGVIDDDIVSFFDAILMSLTFLANYSKIVI